MNKFLKNLGFLAVMVTAIIFGIPSCLLLFLGGTPFHDNPSQWLLEKGLGVFFIAIPVGLFVLVFQKDLKAFRETKTDFLRNWFGNKQSAATSSVTATVNPFTIDVVIKSGVLFFKCPTCPNTLSATLQQIDPIIGVSVACSGCKNISHVPGTYITEPKHPDARITGSVRVPIAKLWDWYYEHPFIISLIRNGDPTLLYDYGLWAFCGACYHQFPATVIVSFIMTQRNPTIFSARTPDHAIDMNGLRDGHCSHCQYKELIIVVSEIPEYVRNIITSKRK